MILIISIIFISIGLLLLLIKFFIKYFNNNIPVKRKNKLEKFAVLIPARDESRVIEDLLISIENQSIDVNEKDIYVIVERIDDPTVAICKLHSVNIMFRKDLSLKRKGYALNDIIEDIYSKKYDAYFVFDADNVLDKNYFKQMISTYNKGYDIGLGYRKIKNKDNSISISSGLIFTLINGIINRINTKSTINAYLSGTGYFISGNIINKLRGYPFNSLAEDYELSLYATINNLTTCYNEKAIFYDEQPTTFKEYFDQRTRWVKGYFEARRKYIKDLFRVLKRNNKNIASVFSSIIGVYDILLIIIGLILLFIKIMLISHGLSTIILNIVLFLLIIYVLLTLFTCYLLHIEKKQKISSGLKAKTMLINPLLMFTYILCLIKCIFVRNIEWVKIDHGKK